MAKAFNKSSFSVATCMFGKKTLKREEHAYAVNYFPSIRDVLLVFAKRRLALPIICKYAVVLQTWQLLNRHSFCSYPQLLRKMGLVNVQEL